MRKILVMTGIRSEFFFLRPLLEAIRDDEDLELILIVTGANLTPMHGNMVETIEKDFQISAKIENLIFSDSKSSRIKSLGVQLPLFIQVCETFRPDILFTTGDREEAAVMALTGAYLNIPVFHYAAGDLGMGTADDTVRHAISKMAHVMLTITEDSAQRLVRWGEEPWRVHIVGHLGQDRYRTTPVIERSELFRRLGLEDRPTLLVLQHPAGLAPEQAGYEIEQTLIACVKTGYQTVAIYPNSDPGSHSMISTINKWEMDGKIKAFRTVPDNLFVNLLRNIEILVGNSSMGILEVPYLHIPVINTGIRQTGRSVTKHVKFTECKEEEIFRVLMSILNNSAVASEMRNAPNLYGDGFAVHKTMRVLKETPLDKRLLLKNFS